MEGKKTNHKNYINLCKMRAIITNIFIAFVLVGPFVSSFIPSSTNLDRRQHLRIQPQLLSSSILSSSSFLFSSTSSLPSQSIDNQRRRRRSLTLQSVTVDAITSPFEDPNVRQVRIIIYICIYLLYILYMYEHSVTLSLSTSPGLTLISLI